jgi:hypothetical protein
MDYEQKIIEFLSQGQNLNFLFELGDLLPKVRQHLRKELNAAFREALSKSPVLEGYQLVSDGNDIYYKNHNYQDSKYYHLGVCVRLDADETFFGIIGSRDIDSANPHYESLQSKLKTFGMQGPWKNWFVWKAFSAHTIMNEVYLQLKADNALGIFEDWIAEFNEFAEALRPNLEALNQWISSNQV